MNQTKKSKDWIVFAVIAGVIIMMILVKVLFF